MRDAQTTALVVLPVAMYSLSRSCPWRTNTRTVAMALGGIEFVHTPGGPQLAIGRRCRGPSRTPQSCSSLVKWHVASDSCRSHTRIQHWRSLKPVGAAVWCWLSVHSVCFVHWRSVEGGRTGLVLVARASSGTALAVGGSRLGLGHELRVGIAYGQRLALPVG